MKEDPPLEAKCRDKFLVQSVAVTADREFSNVASIVRWPFFLSLGAIEWDKANVGRFSGHTSNKQTSRLSRRRKSVSASCPPTMLQLPRLEPTEPAQRAFMRINCAHPHLRRPLLPTAVLQLPLSELFPAQNPVPQIARTWARSRPLRTTQLRAARSLPLVQPWRR